MRARQRVPVRCRCARCVSRSTHGSPPPRSSSLHGCHSSTVTALTKVDLTIPQGQLVAIQGPTGGGKSTLLQMLGALDRPTAGSIHLGERDVAKLGDGALTGLRATENGFVFQSFNLIPTLTALENVETAFAGSLTNRSRTEVRQRATAAL